MPRETLIRAVELSRVYGKGESAVRVFSDISFEVQEGEILMIMGPSGVGKSTLLHLLGGLDLPTEGQVFIDEEEISALSEEARVRFRRKRVGMVFQFHHLLDEFTVLENVAIPLLILKEKKRDAFRTAASLLRDLDLEGKEKRFIQELSGGEQQRVALARAMVTGANLILADEPTGNLDRETEESAMRLFAKLHGQNGWTSVIVTHNEALLDYADRALRFEDGQLRNLCV